MYFRTVFFNQFFISINTFKDFVIYKDLGVSIQFSSLPQHGVLHN